jgi:DNA-binding transcriptional ArsR family regulator
VETRTAHLLDALDPVAVRILVELLREPLTEAELLDAISASSQPTAHRRINRLRRAGVVAKEPGKPHAPNRLWTVLHPEETDALVTAVFGLSDAIDARAKTRREEAQRKLKLARAARLGIRTADPGTS